MARQRFELNFEELGNVLEEFEEMGGTVEEAVEIALKETHAYMTPLIEEKVSKSNLPAKGKYGDNGSHSLKQVIKEPNLKWEGTTCSVDIGFSLDETIVPIFLIRGTHTMKPVNGLKQLLEGSATKKKVAELQHDVLVDEILKRYGQ